MAEAKTKPTAASVDKHLAAVATDAQRADAQALIVLMRRVTGEEPRMWGPSIIGFGSYHYRYDSGREGNAALTGFAIRKGDLTVYITAGFDGLEPLLAKLGKHKASKACLYIKRLSDIDPRILEKLIARSVAEMKRRYPAAG
jgi:Domain of unknown function (DU1801)